MDGKELPTLKTDIPGPKSKDWVSRLALTECPAITARRSRRADETGVPQDPIVWESASGANVRDVDGNIYVDLTGAFAVSGPAHRHPRVVAAGHQQLDRLIHAMGDVYPSAVKIEFCERLARAAPGELTQSILGMSGADAITAALKTAKMKSGKPGVISFWGGYHGLSYGALAVTGYRSSFRAPFVDQLNPHVRFFPYPDPYRPFCGPDQDVSKAVLDLIRETLRHPASGSETIGAILVEPIQGRGGEIVPPAGFLAGLRSIADEFDLVLIFDEIFTGFGRTGRMFACDWESVIPDIMCVGKALGGGVPLSAAIGTPDVMGAWGLSQGEAIHTSTFLGNPMSCAMGLAVLDVLEEDDWPSKVNLMGLRMQDDLLDLAARHDAIGQVRGRGMMIGVDLVSDAESKKPDAGLALLLMQAMRAEGYLILPSGVHGNVIGLSPPFDLGVHQWEGFLDTFEKQIVKGTTQG